MKLSSVPASILGAIATLFLTLALPVLASKTPPTHSIDINLAGAKELQELPGVGPNTAKAIIDFRTKTGRFRRVEDLLAIRGISEAKLAKMRPYITVGPPPQKPPQPPPPKKPPSPQPNAAAGSTAPSH
jgi:competence ComEA-like helix-hairpin-helix protein